MLSETGLSNNANNPEMQHIQLFKKKSIGDAVRWL